MHLLLWLLVFIPIPVALIVLFNQNIDKLKTQMPPSFHYNLQEMIWAWAIDLINFIIVFYVFYHIIHYLLKRSNISRKNILLAIFIFCLLIVQKHIWDLLPMYNTKGLTLTKKFAGISYIGWAFTIVITLIQGFLALSFKTILAYFDEKKKRKDLETINLKNELNVIRSQINPHFLFNTLNNIDSLINKDPGRASELLIKLSDEMRYMLYDANIEKIDIGSELKFLNNYLSLQKIRINKKNPVIEKIEIDNMNEKIPPLLFLPVVENAFKHGSFAKQEDSIELQLILKQHVLSFSVKNPYIQKNSSVNGANGLGLDLVKRRLGLVFPDKHKFEVKKDELNFIVEFSIDLNET